MSQLIEKIHLKNSYNTFTMIHINLYHSLIYPFSLSSSTSTCFSAFPTAKIQACKHDKHPNKSKLILNRSGGLRIEHQAVRERTWTKCLALSLLVDSACHVKKLQLQWMLSQATQDLLTVLAAILLGFTQDKN